ncbi:glycoside hydrolase family 88 protein [Niabella drilacis]|uniref:Glycosyl Hydrolase Family 88 n=1 Tax=Niabella drilacis (strain DSM 25811 / CCM 8410 / CCUG 62505 / LMG 26954 / E90) TaxID=1285928 RepID=A0A1G6U8H5_NIADE|nr:glycoside hydrolase family 88 protein [Niabella drilacis]SDD37658.1 Glycosyl Hydrolase Family 88 [Niabella drilacis]
MLRKKNFILPLVVMVLVSCAASKGSQRASVNDLAEENLLNGEKMLQLLLKDANAKFSTPRGAYPRTISKNGQLVTTSIYDWTPGFFPGNLWYAYEYSKNAALKAEALRWTEKLEPLKNFTEHHDLGFMMYCSYGNAWRLTQNAAYKDVLVQSARSLATRFDPRVGSIKSWNRFDSWHGNKTYHYPVIVDNLMNLELLFFASEASGDPSFKNIAVTHALNAMKNQVRPDFGTYHVVCYDTASSAVVGRETAQGYADNSTWARGQAWAIYGFTMIYRFTKDERFLTTAKGLADYYINNKNLPADKIPYWDFNIGQPGYTPGIKSNALRVKTPYRDASAAAITASALLELSGYVDQGKAGVYRQFAEATLQTLAGPGYRAAEHTNGNFILKHSVGSIPHNNEIDVPLVYADYYFLEALLRYRKLTRNERLF